MTIAISVLVPEGIVLAADSRSSYVNKRGNVRVASDYSKKVFQLTDTVGAVTWGWGYLLRRNISSHIAEFKPAIGTGDSINEITGKLGEFFEEKYEEHVQRAFDQPVVEGTAVGFYVGGYGRDNVGKIFECLIPGKLIRQVRDVRVPGASWAGQVDVISRLIKGYDFRLTELKSAKGVDTDELRQLEHILTFDIMTLQDAIDFAAFMMRTTIEMQRFSDGIFLSPGAVASCGGPIDIAVVQPEVGFRWIQEKKLRGEVLTTQKVGMEEI